MRPGDWLRGRPDPRRSRPLLVGQAPGPRTRPDYPLYPYPSTSAGGRLMGLMGLELHQYTRMFDRVNVLYTFPGKHERDDKFPMTKARPAAEAMRHFLYGREVLLVGRGVAEAFGHEPSYLEWVLEPWWGYRYAVLPHPSGRNRWYNEPGNRERAEEFLRAWVTSLGGDDVVAFSPRTEENQPRVRRKGALR